MIRLWQRQIPRFGLYLQCRSYSSELNSSTLSAVHLGVAFERHTLDLLQRGMSMSLKQVGGKDDGGVDLIGWWWLPEVEQSTTQKRRRLRVFAQCKAEKKKMGPNYVRELEGVLYRFMVDPSSPIRRSQDEDSAFNDGETAMANSQAVALLISQSSFTKSAILRANSSPIPFLLLHVPPIQTEGSESSGNFGTAWCNPALCGTQGLLQDRMEIRWERSSASESGRPGLWWDGHRLLSWTPLNEGTQS